jgi:hypothetical protein
MEIVKSGTVSTIGNWKASATCCNCKADVVVGIHDVWKGSWIADDGSRRSGPMFGCPECGDSNGVQIGDTDFWYLLCARIPPDKRAWQMKSGHDQVKAPGRLLKLRLEPGTDELVTSELESSPASRLLDGCMSILEAQFTSPHDEIVVDIATAGGVDRAGAIETEVVVEVIRRLQKKNWIVETIRDCADTPVRGFRVKGDQETLERGGWIKRS